MRVVLCCQSWNCDYSPPVIEPTDRKAESLGCFDWFKTQNNQRPPPESGGKKGTNMKSISAIICALVLLGSMAVVRAESCCDKAKAAGKDCEHKCCVKAKKEGKTCEKCNPPKEEKK